MALWTALVALVTCGLYVVQEHRFISEEQFMLLISLLIPVTAFMLSGAGQDVPPAKAES